jgi:spermidine synthase
MDLRAPHNLQVAYTRTMFASLLIKPQQKSCLIVGLGGGAMVQFLNHSFPGIQVDAVEIDPVMVRIARDYFGTKPGPRTRIFTEDAFKYLKRATRRYDVIYMDAFLKPGEATDLTGAPRNLKTVAFLKSLHGKLRDKGLVVFNLNENRETRADIRSIQAAFPSVYIFNVSGSGNIVVAGSLARNKVPEEELRKRGEMLDRIRDHGFSFRALADQLGGRR